MISIEVVFPRIQVPASHFLTIYAMKVVITDIAAPVVFGQECTIWFLPCLILYVCGDGIFRESRQRSVSYVGACIRERDVVQTPECPELAQSWEGMVDKVLVRSMETIIDDPMKVTLGSCELDVDPIATFVGD